MEEKYFVPKEHHAFALDPNLSPGQKVQMVAFEDRIEMIPVRKIC